MKMRVLLPVSLLVCIATASTAHGQYVLGGIANWSAPASWSPTRAAGVRALSDATPPLPFIGLPPCRILDTRGNGAPIQGGIFTGGSDLRNYTIPPICGVPVGVAAVSLNFTVTGPGQTAAGFLLAWPTGGAVPTVSILNWDRPQQQIANAAVVPTNGSGSITVNVSSPTHVIMDVNGYYSSSFGNPQNYFFIDNNSTLFSIYSKNSSPTCFGACGILSEVYSTNGTGAVAIWGDALGVTGNQIGVRGRSFSTDAGYGVYDSTASNAVTSAGVYGVATTNDASGGRFDNSPRGIIAFVGSDAGLNTNGGVLASTLYISGSKNFISPHPVDPSKEIRYASVEAPTVDVYFRGTATLSNGYARIEVPEHFRFTAREGTYMTMLTPVGRPVGLSVESEGPEGIIVRGTGNSRFHYVVYAERAEIEGYEPVQQNVHFTPEALERIQLLKTLPRTTKALLIRNGTLNEDGTYNEETARAMGWVIPEKRHF